MAPTANLVLNTDRIKSNGKYPVKLRVIFNRKRKDFITNIDLTEEEFSEAVKANPRKNFRVLANELVSIREKANTIIKQQPHFTFSRFESLFYDFNKDASDIYPFFEDYIKELEEEDRIKTAVSYKTAMNALKAFHPKKLNLYDITPTLLTKFQKYQETKGNSMTTTGIYLRSLRTIYNICVTKGIIRKDENYPFGRGKYIIPAGRNIKKALAISEVANIAKYETIPGSYADRAKDFWMLSYFLGGINFKDLLLLRKGNIDNDMLRYVRQKTKKTSQGNQTIISVYIPEEAKLIINKWKAKVGDEKSLLFPFIAEVDDSKSISATINQFIQNTNKNIKKICAAVGIEKNVTTYFSRHSAATVLKRSGASINQIQEMLGHASTSVTQKYLDSFDDETKKDLSKSLLFFKDKKVENG